MTARHRAGFAVLLALSGVVAAGGCFELAVGRYAPGAVDLVAAFLGVVSASLLRLNERLFEANRKLLEMNERLLVPPAPPEFPPGLARAGCRALTRRA